MRLQRILLLDAATCGAMGLALLLLAAPLEPLLGLPFALLQYAGLALLPIGAFMAWVGTRAPAPPAGVRIVIAGNVLWVVASLLLLLWLTPTRLGCAFVILQAAAVDALAGLEARAGRRGGSYAAARTGAWDAR